MLARGAVLIGESNISAVTHTELACWIAPSTAGTARDTVSLKTKGPEGGVIGTHCHALWEVAVYRIKIDCLTYCIADIGTYCIAGAI